MSSVIPQASEDPLVKSFMRYIEEETKAETIKIMNSYKDKMSADLEAARQRIVASASLRLSQMMTVHDMGRTVRIEITKQEIQ